MKKVTILAIGSRGDVQPYVALGHGLQAAGLHVTIAAVEHFRGLVEGHGVGFHPVRGDVAQMLSAPAAQSAMEAGGNPIKAVRGLLKMAEPVLMPLADDCWAAAQGADAIMVSTLGTFGYPIAHKLGIPLIPAIPYPLLIPTRAFPSPVWPIRPWPRALNRLTYLVMEQVAWQLFRPYMTRWMRDSLGMEPYPLRGPFREAQPPTLLGYSTHLIPRPADWPERIHVTGYWFLPEASNPPVTLADFVGSGEPPVYVGFGSMQSRDPEAATQTVIEALRRVGRRGVLLTGWNGLRRPTTQPDDMHFVEGAPHGWLFPRVAAVVHHGGAGTTAAGLRAGVPSVIVPHFADQPFWGRRVYAAGVGPRPLPRQQMSTETLAERLGEALGSEAMRANAARLGEQIRAEDGVSAAVEVVQRVLSAR